MSSESTSDSRPAEFYLVPADAALVSGRICALLDRHAKLNDFRIASRGFDPELDAQLQAIHLAGLRWSSRGRTEPTNRREPEPVSEWVMAGQAADLLHISPRAVQKAIQRGRLPAEQVGGRYRIHRDDIEHYRQTRGSA